MKIITLFLVIVFLNSCGSIEKTKEEFKVIQLKGEFKELNYWKSNEEGYENAIFDNESEYATISKTSSGLGLINRKGELIIPAIFNGLMTGFDENGFCKVQKNGKYGLYNKSGIEILNPEFDDIFNDLDLRQGLIKVTKNELSGFVDFNGKIVIPIKYQALGEPSKNLIPYMSEPANWGYLDFQGKIIVKPQFGNTFLGEKGEAFASKGGEIFIIYENGKMEKIEK